MDVIQEARSILDMSIRIAGNKDAIHVNFNGWEVPLNVMVQEAESRGYTVITSPASYRHHAKIRCLTETGLKYWKY